MNAKKVTLATVKAFVRKHRAELLIDCISDFDGMVDGVRQCGNRGFHPVTLLDSDGTMLENSMGIRGAWFVLRGRDYFQWFERDGLQGIHVENCFRSFDLAIRTHAAQVAA